MAALLVMAFLIAFSADTLFRQFDEIAKFTDGAPEPVEVTSLDNQEEEINGLAERLESFRHQLTGQEVAVLALTPAEANLVIAAYEPFRDFRGIVRVVAVEGDALRLAIALPLNGKPRLARKDESGWLTSDLRYLNGELIARPVLSNREVVLQFDAMRVAGAQVPQEFIDQMSPYRISERYLSDPVLGPAMAKLTRVGLADGQLVFTRVPGEIPTEAIANPQVDSFSRWFFRVLGIAACGFAFFAGLMAFVRRRAKTGGA